MTHPIPRAALEDRLGFTGTAGSGKTYNAGSAAERLLHDRQRVVVPDPLGVWWGLRLNADGRSKGFDVIIFGGPHGDLPLTENAGALIGETVATMKESCILDLSQLGTKASERRFMLAFLTAFYRKANGEPVHIIFDEADMWAPQRLMDRDGDAARLLGMMETIVRRGRIKGFIPWLITQRPAVLSKDVLSQVDGLITFKLTSSQDRDAIGSWVEGQADKGQWSEIWKSLPTLGRGEGVIWLPSRGILKTAAFPKKATFDSSATPKRGERPQGKQLKPLNLDRVKERLVAVEAETRTNDPKALRADIAKLQAEKAALERQMAAAVAQKVVADPDALRKAEERGFERAKRKLAAAAKREANARIKKGLAGVLGYVTALVDTVNADLADLRKQETELAVEFAAPPAAPPVAYAGGGMPRPAPSVPPSSPAPARPAAPDASGDRPLGAERKPLSALAAVHPAGMTEAQWAVAAGLKRKGGTWSTYLSRLRQAGRIEKQGDLYVATAQGIADLGGDIATLPPPGPALVQFWIGKINGVGPMLNRLAEIYPAWTTREQLGADINLATSGGTFSTYLSRLRTPGLIEVSGDQVRAAPQLMEAA